MEAGSILRMVYLTEKEWSSIASTLLIKEAFQYYHSIFLFIDKICCSLKFSTHGILHASMIYFHKYFLINGRPSSISDKLMISTACVFLATKAINRLISINDLSSIVLQVTEKHKTFSMTKEEIKEAVCAYETDIMATIGFELDIDLPFKFMQSFKKFVESRNLNMNSSKFYELCCYKLKETLIFPLCLYFNPDVIAIACIQWLLHQLKRTIAFEEIALLSEYVVTIGEVEECEKYIQVICNNIDVKYNNPKANSNSQQQEQQEQQTQPEKVGV